MIKYIRGIHIKMVQSFAALVKLWDGIWASVDKHGRLFVGIHVNSKLTGNINEFQDVDNVIWVVENV